MSAEFPLRSLILLAVILAGELPAMPQTQKEYQLGIAPADVDTSIEKYMDTVNGLDTQCDTLNNLLQSVCCAKYDLGCGVKYTCRTVSIDEDELLTDAAYRYAEEGKPPNYAIHHGSVLDSVLQLQSSLERYGRAYGMLVLGYTRHWIQVDDEETKNIRHKINPSDLSFYFLGSVLPGLTERNGRAMNLDYYASKNGILMTASPTNATSLAQALSEYRSSIFSFNMKAFTGTGSRDFFELDDHGNLVPNLSGCTALTEMMPSYYRAILDYNRSD